MTYLEHSYKVVALDVCEFCKGEVTELCAETYGAVCTICCEHNHVQDDVIVDHRYITFMQ